jgi:hypothetical protein
MRLRIVVMILALTTLFAAPASAMILGLNWGTGLQPMSIKYDGATHNVYAGSLKGYFGGQLGNNKLPPQDGTYFADLFCVDLDHWITIPTEYDVQPLTTASLTHGGQAAWLYQNYISTAKNSGGTSAALQLALWDVVTDGGDGLDQGKFQYISPAGDKSRGQATDMLMASAGRTATVSYFKATGTYGQSMIGPVPEPGSLGLLGVGLGILTFGLLRRRS